MSRRWIQDKAATFDGGKHTILQSKETTVIVCPMLRASFNLLCSTRSPMIRLTASRRRLRQNRDAFLKSTKFNFDLLSNKTDAGEKAQ